MSQTRAIGNVIAAAERSAILTALLARSDRTGLRAFGTDDVGRVEQITFLRGTGKKGKRGVMFCGESVTLVCLEKDARWQPLPGHRPSSERKKRDVEARKSEMKARADRINAAHSAASY